MKLKRESYILGLYFLLFILILFLLIGKAANAQTSKSKKSDLSISDPDKLHLEEDQLPSIREGLPNRKKLKHFYLNQHNLQQPPISLSSEKIKSLTCLESSDDPIYAHKVEGFKSRLAPNVSINFSH